MSQYTCGMCGGVFELVESADWNSEKAVAEFKKEFPDEQKDEKVVVCDDCYKVAMGIKEHFNKEN